MKLYTNRTVENFQAHTVDTSCEPASDELCRMRGADSDFVPSVLSIERSAFIDVCFLALAYSEKRVSQLMSKQPYKYRKKGVGRHVQLPEWLQSTQAWDTMQPGPRALYIEIKRRFNGSNNGEIYLSHRDAAKALNVHRNTVGAWFNVLQERGFIFLSTPPYLGPNGIGKASKWRLQELPTQDGKPATKSFVQWREKQNPRTKKRTPRHKKQDASDKAAPRKAGTVLNFVTQSTQSRKVASQ